MLLTMQITTVSTLNRREHWAQAAKRKAQHRQQVRAAISGIPPPSTPCVVVLTRYSSGTLDEHDNLPSAFKHVVDELADWIGVNDGDKEKVRWMYAQSKVKRGKTWITVEVVQ